MNKEGLISVLEANEAITHVYFDKNGGWLFVPNNLHPTVMTRDEVINEYLQDAPPVDTTEEPNADFQQDAPPVDTTGKGSKKK
jgi:hypothetical protein